MTTDTLLIEIGTEELPPKALKSLATSLQENLLKELESNDLSFGESKWYATPKRLAVEVSDLSEAQNDKVVEKRGPAVTAAFDTEGNPTKAAEGWAKSNGISVSEADRLKTDKGEWLLHKQSVEGKNIDSLIQDVLEKAIKKLPIPKPMRWGNSNVEFIRPVHSILVMFGSKVLPVTLLGKESANKSLGHRFHAPDAVSIKNPGVYQETLMDNKVIVSFEDRKTIILNKLKEAAEKLDAVVDFDQDLLDEVTALVEWPVVLEASFEEHFLKVPKESLIYTMKDDQKYFPLLDQKGNLLPKFLFVTNIESKDPSQIISGNEKVIRPRLADAEFFYNTDLKVSQDTRLDSLNSVVFQKQLGTLRERTQRIGDLAAEVAETIGANATDAKRAGLLTKSDLASNMVLEFPAVQGVMGGYYALAEGESSTVAEAIQDHYNPKYSGDRLPRSSVGLAVSIAEKMDTLVGIFGIGMIPKGDKDPFALRRAAIGVLRMCIEGELDLDLKDVVRSSTKLYGNKLTNDNTSDDVVEFMLNRFSAFYSDKGVDTRIVNSVLQQKPTRPLDFAKRITAVQEFLNLDSAEELIAANKRVANILRKSNVASDNTNVKVELLTDSAELSLYRDMQMVVGEIGAKNDYTFTLNQLASLKDKIDGFFDNVMVNADEEELRNNRLALLNTLRQSFLSVADVSLLN